MAGVRVVRRAPAQGGRFHQFVVVALMVMLLKSSHESAARAYRPRGLPGTRGGASGERRGDAGGGARLGVHGAHADAGAADISSLKELTRVVEFAARTISTTRRARPRGRGAGRRGDVLANATDVSYVDAKAEASKASASWTRASFPAPFPSDVSGTYKGKWTLVSALGPDGERSGRATGNPLPGMHAFLDEGGVGAAVLQLRSRWDPARRVQAVVGEASIRDGAYISDDDQHQAGRACTWSRTGMPRHARRESQWHPFADANATAAAATAAGDGDKYDAYER